MKRMKHTPLLLGLLLAFVSPAVATDEVALIRRLGFEFKYSDTPRTTKSMHVALADLKLDHLYVVHPGQHTFPLTRQITATPLPALSEIL